MGSFPGHAIPGSFFLVFSLWWMIHMLTRYYKHRTKRTPSFQSTATFPCPVRYAGLTSFPIEAVLKILFAVIGCSGEILWSLKNDVGGVPIGNKQHVTMFAAFGISGVVDLILQYRDILPPDTDYAAMLFAFGVEFILFHFHIVERSKLGILLHQLLAYTIAVNLLAILTEMKYRNNILIALSRPFFLFLQGTWFWQIAIILYNPVYRNRWDENSEDNLILAQTVYAWHVAGCFIAFCIISSIIAFCFREKSVKSGDYYNLKILENNPSRVGNNMLISDDSDVE